jgi:hypothetical protein
MTPDQMTTKERSQANRRHRLSSCQPLQFHVTSVRPVCRDGEHDQGNRILPGVDR